MFQRPRCAQNKSHRLLARPGPRLTPSDAHAIAHTAGAAEPAHQAGSLKPEMCTFRTGPAARPLYCGRGGAGGEGLTVLLLIRLSEERGSLKTSFFSRPDHRQVRVERSPHRC